ncbi:MAG: transglycosylase domain-containing protein, partial [Thermoguttaceae bacterium]|nr:transglycosylase domain-containing protein [Thermoguttaceae bacterium]
ITRKVKEQYLAVSLENALEKQLGSKEDAKKYVLELYLNTIALHHGLHGVEAASPRVRTASPCIANRASGSGLA